MTPNGFIMGFVARQHTRAEELARYGAREASAAVRQVVDDLDREFQAWSLEELTVSEAARESGYSPEGLREQIREGRLPATRKGSGSTGPLLISRCDLSCKPAKKNTPNGNDIAARLLTD